MFIPSIKQTENNVNFHCNGGAADIKYCPAKDKQLDKCLISQLENSNETVSCQVIIKYRNNIFNLKIDTKSETLITLNEIEI